MRTSKVNPVSPVSKVTNNKKRVATPVKMQYLGDVDPAVFVHHNRTHRSASEAFRDADYATPIWKCESDAEQAWRFLKDMVVGGLVVGIPLFILISLALEFFK